jgi:hypothetical protein
MKDMASMNYMQDRHDHSSAPQLLSVIVDALDNYDVLPLLRKFWYTFGEIVAKRCQSLATRDAEVQRVPGAESTRKALVASRSLN